MKTIKISTAFFCLLLISSGIFAQGKKKSLEQLELKIEGMTCEVGCAKGIEGAVYKMKGVKKSEVDFDKSIATIVFDNSKTNAEEVIKQIESYNPGEGEKRRYAVTLLKQEPYEP